MLIIFHGSFAALKDHANVTSQNEVIQVYGDVSDLIHKWSLIHEISVGKCKEIVHYFKEKH